MPRRGLPKTDAPDIEDAIRLHDDSVSLREQGEYKKTELSGLEALEILQKLLGTDHPDVAVTLSNLALLYKSQKRYIEAENLYERSLSIFEKTLGPTHPHLIISLENYARLLREMNREPEALKLESRIERHDSRHHQCL